jgi:alpha-galactosidase
LRPITDYAHRQGLKSIVWFEPERVAGGTWLAQAHPEWLLGGQLLNLGLPVARDWAIGHFSACIHEQGIDLYRQDFNLDPLPHWRGADPPDRQGMTENLHVQGQLAFWDGLLARRPGLRIDSCASGGRRNDLETMRRSVPLLRSDRLFNPDEQQAHSFGLAAWLPLHGTGIAQDCFSAYGFLSCMTPAPILCYDQRPGATGDFAAVARWCGQWRAIAPAMLGDYYPLTPWSVADDAWIAWQFDLPAERRGYAVAFRRARAAAGELTLALRGLDPAATYLVRFPETGTEQRLTGRALAALPVKAEAAPAAVLLTYQRK